jgi:hypothetical protein
MMVTDLRHFLDLPTDAPGPARRLAEQLGNIVRAATAGEGDIAWESALPCRRRPANRPCPGRIVVLRSETSATIRWQCSACGDDGVISNWADSASDLRRRRPVLVRPVNEIAISAGVAGALRELQLLDPDCERVVFRARAHSDGVVLLASDDDVDELIGAVAAEANHESNRRRQRRLDAAVDALSSAADTPDERA